MPPEQGYFKGFGLEPLLDWDVNISPSVLQSTIQKAVRRGRTDIAIHAAASMWAHSQKARTKLVRRVPIIILEDSVLTPNYDRLFEYVCDYAGILYANGFSGGVERKTGWNTVGCSLRSRERDNYGRKSQVVCKHKKHVRIYKVHGSLNYFFHKAEQERDPDFLRLANALSALYSSGSEEKRLLDAMLLAVPR